MKTILGFVLISLIALNVKAQVPCDSIIVKSYICDSVPLYQKCGFWCRLGLVKPQTTKWSYLTCRDTIQINYPCYKTKMGVLVNGSQFNTTRKCQITRDSLHCSYVRDALNVNKWNGVSDKDIDTDLSYGLTVVMNVNSNIPGSASDYATDTVWYKKQVSEVIQKYKPFVSVIENEELNDNFFKVDTAKYIRLLRIASGIVHSYGLKITDGGIYGNGLYILIWRWYNEQGRTSERDSFAAACMDANVINCAAHPGKSANYELKAAQVQAILNADKKYSDYVNLHIYQDTLHKEIWKALHSIQEYVKATTGKEVISNEMGQRTIPDPKVVDYMLVETDLLNFPIMCWFSGDGVPAVGLQNYDGSLRDNGKAFRDYQIGTRP